MLADMNDVHVLTPHLNVRWGDFSMVSMVLRCIDWLITECVNFGWMVLLSGQDYPIQPLHSIEAFLERSTMDGYIDWSNGRFKNQNFDRYFFRYYRLAPMLMRVLRRLSAVNRCQSLFRLIGGSVGSWVGVRSFSPPFNAEFHCFRGSMWWSLSQRCVAYIHQSLGRSRKLVTHYRRTLIPDESFFQTILLNEPSFQLENDDKRCIMWKDPGAASPAILTARDFDKIIASGKHFARKFDINVDAVVLDMLDGYINAAKSGLRESY
jgi:hypothetical protein